MRGNKSNKNDATLYDRLGGDSFIKLLTCAFFDELVENPDLKPFFENISKSALKCHQVKLFRVIFGKEDEKPEDEDILDFMLRTHTRLFRELGLDENHFDQVATCFVQGLQTFQVDQGLIDECVAILMPLRTVFEYGAQVAAKEKTMTNEELRDLPKASPKTFGTDEAVVLPEYSKIKVPQWLPETLRKHSHTSNVRAWTCDMTDRFGPEGDVAIADTFMDQPYMDHHCYCLCFLQLAFLPDDVDPGHREKVLNIVRFPRGSKNAPLSKELYDRMISKFLLTCYMMGMPAFTTSAVESKLRTYHSTFADKTTKIGGIDAQHILLKVHKKKQKKSSSSKLISKSSTKERSSTNSLASLSSCTSISSSPTTNSTSSISLTLFDFDSNGPWAKLRNKKKNSSAISWTRSIFKPFEGLNRRKDIEPRIPATFAA